MNFNEVSFEFAAGTVKQLPQSDIPEIVFSGHSNVGKSSLINKLGSSSRSTYTQIFFNSKYCSTK